MAMLSLPINSVWALTNQQCESRHQNLSMALADRSYSLENMYQSLKRQSPDVFLFGEHHRLTRVTSKYSEVIKRLKEDHPQINCLVLEVPDRAEEHRTIQYLENKYPNGYNQGVGGMTPYGVLSTAVNRGDISPFSKLPNSSWAETLLDSLKYGMKLIAIDHNEASVLNRVPEFANYSAKDLRVLSASELEHLNSESRAQSRWSTSTNGMNARDAYMTNKITELLSNGTCEKIVGLFGKGHLSNHKVERDNLNRRLIRELGSLKVASLNFQYTGQGKWIMGTHISPYWEWVSCEDNPSPPRQLRAVPGNLSLLNRVPLYENGPGDFDEFSYHLIFPIL